MRVEALERLIRSRGQGTPLLWRATRRGRLVASAIVIQSPGRFGMLFHCPETARGLEPEALVAVVRAAARDALARGASYVQALPAPAARGDIAVLAGAGFKRIAELIYMRLALGDLPAAEAGGDIEADENVGPLSWQTCDEVGDAKLAEVISATYEGSLDCPALTGLRAAKDIIAGHKAATVFRAETWWVLLQGERAGGCILVNDVASLGVADITYMGLVPDWRGKGLGRLMLRRAARAAQQRKMAWMTLAVDARNWYAARLYGQCGFREVYQRFAYMMLRTDAANSGSVDAL